MSVIYICEFEIFFKEGKYLAAYEQNMMYLLTRKVREAVSMLSRKVARSGGIRN